MGPMQGKIRDGVMRTVQMDCCSHGILTLTPQQSSIYKGCHFAVSYSVASVGALTTPDDLMTLSFTTPANGSCCHMSIHASGSAGALVKLIEGKSGGGATPTGTLQTYNNKRASSVVATILDVAGANASKVSYDATAFTGGIELMSEYLTGTKSSSDVAAPDTQWVLKPATLYQVSLYNNAANPGTLTLNWCECESKDDY